MKEMYAIYHVFDVEGEFGDPIEKRELVAISANKALAEKYAEEYDCTHAYKDEFLQLFCGQLEVEKLDIPLVDEGTIPESPWEKTSPENQAMWG